MSNQEIAELSYTLPYSYQSVKEVHDKLPAKYQNEEYVKKAFNTGFPFAFADILSHSELEKQKIDNEQFLEYLKITYKPKPTIKNRIRNFILLIRNKLKI